MSSTSIGRGPASGGNENHDGDPCHTTLGEAVKQEPPAGSKATADTAAVSPEGQPGTEPDEAIPPPHKGCAAP